jgi:ATP/maltotriose-dependent transcriptional regulator MalT
MASGQFAEAASIFDRLSDEARQRNMPVRAADLSLQASRAHFAVGAVEVALERAKQALRLFAGGGKPGRIAMALPKMTALLHQHGYSAQADELEQEAAQILEEAGISFETVQRTPQPVAERCGTLPARCEGCGAPLVPDEVEWHDAHTAECPYCGTLAKAA